MIQATCKLAMEGKPLIYQNTWKKWKYLLHTKITVLEGKTPLEYLSSLKCSISRPLGDPNSERSNINRKAFYLLFVWRVLFANFSQVKQLWVMCRQCNSDTFTAASISHTKVSLLVFPTVLVFTRTESIFFVAGAVLCFGFSKRIILRMHWCFSCCSVVKDF